MDRSVIRHKACIINRPGTKWQIFVLLYFHNSKSSPVFRSFCSQLVLHRMVKTVNGKQSHDTSLFSQGYFSTQKARIYNKAFQELKNCIQTQAYNKLCAALFQVANVAIFCQSQWEYNQTVVIACFGTLEAFWNGNVSSVPRHRRKNCYKNLCHLL